MLKKSVCALAVVALISLGAQFVCSAVWASVIIWLPTPTPHALIIESTAQATTPGPSPTLAHALHTISPAAPQATASPTNSPTNRPPMVAKNLPNATNTPPAYPVATNTHPPPPPAPTDAPPPGPTATIQTDIGLPPVPPTEAP